MNNIFLIACSYKCGDSGCLNENTCNDCSDVNREIGNGECNCKEGFFD